MQVHKSRHRQECSTTHIARCVWEAGEEVEEEDRGAGVQSKSFAGDVQSLGVQLRRLHS